MTSKVRACVRANKICGYLLRRAGASKFILLVRLSLFSDDSKEGGLGLGLVARVLWKTFPSISESLRSLPTYYHNDDHDRAARNCFEISRMT